MGNLVDIKSCVKEEKCLVRSDQNFALVYNFRKLFNPLTPTSDHDRISPNNIKTISRR